MSEHAGPLRTEAGLTAALVEIAALRQDLGAVPRASSSGRFDSVRLDWFDARNMCLVAEAVVRGALQRRESRGAHQREDYPGLDAAWALHQTVRLDRDLVLDRMGANTGARERAQ